MAEVQLLLDVALADHATFDDFVVGANAAAVAALRDQAEGAGGAGAAMIYLHGPAGTGKSHLLQAACRIGGDSAYLPLRDLAALPAEALQGWERHALLALDDLDAIAGDAAWERAVFALFNAVTDRGGRLLMAAAARPAELGLGLPDLASRLSWGAGYALAPLDDAGLQQALVLRARQRGMTLPDEVAHWLVRRQPHDWAALSTLLERLDRATLEAGRRLTVPFVKSVLNAP